MITMPADPPPTAHALTPADLGLTVGDMRRAFAIGSLKRAIIPRVIPHAGRHWGVIEMHREWCNSRRGTFVLYELHPEHAHPFLFRPETFRERVNRGGDGDDLAGIVVADPDGHRWVVDPGRRVVVGWVEGER